MGKISKAGKRQKSLKIGIFGGAFNPVHNGHINLAEEYISLLGLDRLFVVPTANPPHRAYDDFVPAECRFDMLSLAFGENKTIEISDIEFQSSQKSYTYNTVLKFKEMLGECELFLIVGQDQFLSFDKWYNYEALLKEVTLCTAAREKNSREKIIDFAQALSVYGNRALLAHIEHQGLPPLLYREEYPQDKPFPYHSRIFH